MESRDSPRVAASPDPRWLADEMLGRLARYLRFLGYDTSYAQDLRDLEILRRAREEGRTLLTRDRQLAMRAKASVLLRSLDLEGQLRELRRAYPALRGEVRFLRCSLCNALLASADRSSPVPPWGVPEPLWGSSEPVYVCPSCGQAYWEGSHTREIRATLERVFRPGAGARGTPP